VKSNIVGDGIGS